VGAATSVGFNEWVTGSVSIIEGAIFDAKLLMLHLMESNLVGDKDATSSQPQPCRRAEDLLIYSKSSRMFYLSVFLSFLIR
jgi:hypothetical protein